MTKQFIITICLTILIINYKQNDNPLNKSTSNATPVDTNQNNNVTTTTLTTTTTPTITITTPITNTEIPFVTQNINNSTTSITINIKTKNAPINPNDYFYNIYLDNKNIKSSTNSTYEITTLPINLHHVTIELTNTKDKLTNPKTLTTINVHVITSYNTNNPNTYDNNLTYSIQTYKSNSKLYKYNPISNYYDHNKKYPNS